MSGNHNVTLASLNELSEAHLCVHKLLLQAVVVATTSGCYGAVVVVATTSGCYDIQLSDCISVHCIAAIGGACIEQGTSIHSKQ